MNFPIFPTSADVSGVLVRKVHLLKPDVFRFRIVLRDIRGNLILPFKTCRMYGDLTLCEADVRKSFPDNIHLRSRIQEKVFVHLCSILRMQYGGLKMIRSLACDMVSGINYKCLPVVFVEDEKVMVEEPNCYLLKVTAIKASLT
jgi:hypothetical protein